LPDADWFRVLSASLTQPLIDGVEFPGFPPVELQETWVGASGEATLRQAYSFYVFVKAQMRSLGHPLVRESRFLDFGCGWGRFLRFFWKDIDEGNLFGCDTNPTIIDLCTGLGLPGQLSVIHPLGPLPYPDGFFDGVLAYSVFTHLPENAHVHWARELARVCVPGGVVCLTLESRRFLDMIADVPQDTPYPRLAGLRRFQPMLSRHATEHALRGFTYFPSVQGVEDVYGDAVCTAGFMAQTWSPDFDLKTYVDHASQMSQAAVALQKLPPDGLPLDGRIEGEIRDIRHAGLFDAEYYRAMYPDIRPAPSDPIHHYCARGWREGRNPAESFDTTAYRAIHDDIEAHDINPFWHYVTRGRAEGRVAADDETVGREADVRFGSVPHDVRLVACYTAPDWHMLKRAHAAARRGTQRAPATHAPRGSGFSDVVHPGTLAREAAICTNHGIAAWCFRVDAARHPDPTTPLASLLANPEVAIGLVIDVDLRGAGVDERARELVTRALSDDRCLRTHGRPVVVLSLPADDDACAATLAACEILLATAPEAYRIVRRDGVMACMPGARAAARCDADLDFPTSPELWATGGFTPRRSDGVDTIPYSVIVSQAIARMAIDRDATIPCYRAVVTGRDESPLCEPRPLRYTSATLKEYRRWLDAAIADAQTTQPAGARLVFLDAWNDWNRGAVLQPDNCEGYGRLNETSRALLGVPSGTVFPKVTIVVLSSDDRTRLRRRLESVYRQTYRNVEVLLVDDHAAGGARDLFVEYAERFPDITTLLTAARPADCFRQWAAGITAASGELVWIAGSDGACDDDLLAKLVRCFDDEAVLLACARTEVRPDEAAIPGDTLDQAASVATRRRRRHSHVKTAHREIAEGLETVIGTLDPGAAVFRRPIDMPLLTDEEWLSSSIAGDWIFYLHAMRGGRIAYVADTCAYVQRRLREIPSADSPHEAMRREFAAATRAVLTLYDAPDTTIESLWQAIVKRSELPVDRDDAVRGAIPADTHARDFRSLRSPAIAIAAMAFSPGGAEVFPIRLANELKRQGHSVLFVNRAFGRQEPGVRRLLRHDIPVVEARDATSTKQLLEEFGVEILNSHHWSIQHYATIVADVFTGLKAHVASLHGMLEHGNESTATPDNLRIADASVSTWVYTTEKNLGPLMAAGLHAAGSSRFVKLPNGIAPTTIEPIVRADHGIPDDAFVLCCVSRAIPEKGWAEAIEAVALARRMTDRDIRLILVGNGPLHDEYCRSGAPEFVSLVGFHENSVGFYAAADMGLMLTRFKSESFPLTIIDCLFAGRPFIATDVGEIRRMLTTDRGLAGDVLQLADWTVPVDRAAASIAAHATRPELVAVARARAVEAAGAFRIDRVAAAYAAVFARDVSASWRLRIALDRSSTPASSGA